MRAQEFLPEKINPDTIDPDFDIKRRMKNGMVIRARGKKIWADMPDFRGVDIEVYDAKEDPELRWPIASTSFKAKQDEKTGEWFMYSLNTGTKERYRRQGIASAMYNFARMLGNDVKPSRLQTHQGQDFWQKGGAGAGRSLELDDEPEYVSEPPPPPPPPREPARPRGFLQRWRRLLFPDTDTIKQPS